MQASVARPICSPDISASEEGSDISGSPVKDSDGTIVGVPGVDETAGTVFRNETCRFLDLVDMG